ncbi:MAG: hypothetical protein CMG46_02550 [Candidatus Marinimicrobia bacterium]|nr:hypothetical protein [Candidatus Neomarinimicrobiota bacterium]
MIEINQIFNEIDESILNIRVPYSKEYIIDKYNLSYIGINKLYVINDTEIISKLDTVEFKVVHRDYEIDNGFIYQSIESIQIPPFNFYNVDYECTYKLYQSIKYDICIELKVYNNYNTLTFYCENKSTFINNQKTFII